MLKLLDLYKGIASTYPMSGSSVYLWDDMWNGLIPKIAYPELYSFAKNKNITLQRAISLQPQLHRIFHIPLYDEAFTQYVKLQSITSDLQASDENDK